MLTLMQGLLDEGKQDKAAECHVQLVVAGEGAPVGFQSAKQPLNFVRLLYNSRSYSQGCFRLLNGGTTG